MINDRSLLSYKVITAEVALPSGFSDFTPSLSKSLEEKLLDKFSWSVIIPTYYMNSIILRGFFIPGKKNRIMCESVQGK